MGTPNREPQEYSRKIIDYKDPVGIFPLYSYYILGVPYLGFPSKSLEFIHGIGHLVKKTSQCDWKVFLPLC